MRQINRPPIPPAMFVATPDVPCGECGADTIAPYVDKRAVLHDGYYCEACGFVTYPPPAEAGSR